MTQDRWIVRVAYRPQQPQTERLVNTTYAGESEEHARNEFTRRTHHLSYPWISSVILTHNGEMVTTWDEWTHLSERQRRIRDDYLAAEKRYKELETTAPRLNTVEAYRAASEAEDAWKWAEQEFTTVMRLTEAEYDKELVIRNNFASKEFVQQWPYGHPELTCTERGAVYWRGEWINQCWDPRRPIQYVHLMAAHCYYLESLGLPVNATTFTFYFDWFRMMEPGEPYKDVLVHLACGYWEQPATGELAFEGVKGLPGVRALYYDGKVWHRIQHEHHSKDDLPHDLWEYHEMCRRGWQPFQLDQGEHAFVMSASLNAVITWLSDHHITPDFFDVQRGNPWCQDEQACQWCKPYLSREQES